MLFTVFEMFFKHNISEQADLMSIDYKENPNSAPVEETAKVSEKINETVAVLELRRKQIKHLFLILICIVVLVFAAAAYSVAWHAKNDIVHSKGTGLSSEAPPTSLFVQEGDVAGLYDQYTYSGRIADADLGGDLYPISLQNTTGYEGGFVWWYPDVWSQGLAAHYVTADVGPDGTYTANGNTLAAYNVETYTVYTDETGSLDVFFDPNNQLGAVVTGEEGTNPRDLPQALRIGLVVNGELKLVYAPAEGTYKKGNSYGAQDGVLYAVTSAATISPAADVYTVVSDLSSGTAVQNEDGTWNGTGKTKLFTADHDGVVVKIYVWLEGTDAETVKGKSDDADGVKISFGMVGAEPQNDN